MAKYKVGSIIKGTVSGIESYGIFVSFEEYYSGLIHISEISERYVKDPHNYVNIGDIIYTKVLDVDEETLHLKLSIKNINYKLKKKYKKHPIVETPKGFSTLEKMLPIWIKEKISKQKI
ncbi:MAG: S1 RNA-binding domain-containing protein [Bacilli bacterium]|nr:S1 RNA-binding domain-containing protein [Bacilli bacterium]